MNAGPPLRPIKLYFWQTFWFQVSFIILCGLMALIIFSLLAQLLLHQKERWLLHQERARIAMDVHDDIGACMTQLVLDGEKAQAEAPPDSKTRVQFEHICEDTRRVLFSLAEIIWAINPSQDTLQGFADYVCNYTQKFLKPSGIECVLDIDSKIMDVTADLALRRSLLKALKEALNNAVKYSGATELMLQIKQQRRNLVVVVQDNGRGFDPVSVQPGGNGLANMNRRMRELGGTCRLTSQVGKGCRVEFCLPLPRPRRFSLAWLRRNKLN